MIETPPDMSIHDERQGLMRGLSALPHAIKVTALRASCNARVDDRPYDMRPNWIERARPGRGMGCFGVRLALSWVRYGSAVKDGIRRRIYSYLILLVGAQGLEPWTR